jgi:hypothetical protein
MVTKGSSPLLKTPFDEEREGTEVPSAIPLAMVAMMIMVMVSMTVVVVVVMVRQRAGVRIGIRWVEHRSRDNPWGYIDRRCRVVAIADSDRETAAADLGRIEGSESRCGGWHEDWGGSGDHGGPDDHRLSFCLWGSEGQES